MNSVAIAGFDSPAACKPRRPTKKDAVYTCTVGSARSQGRQADYAVFQRQLLEASRESGDQRFSIPACEFGVPFRPTPFRVTFHVKAGEVEVTREVPVEFRYVKDIYTGDKRMELNVVPAFSVRITPPLAVIPAVGEKPSSAKSTSR